MIIKFIEFINESLGIKDVNVSVKKNIIKNLKTNQKYDDSDWDLNPYHEFDDLNKFLKGKEIFFVATKVYKFDDDKVHGEVGICRRLSYYKNDIYIQYFKHIGGEVRPYSGILVSDNIVVIKEKEMGELKCKDRVWYHLGVGRYNWLYCEIVAFDVEKNKVFIVDWNGDGSYPFTFWVNPEELFIKKT